MTISPFLRGWALIVARIVGAFALAMTASAGVAAAASYVPSEVLVGYRSAPAAAADVSVQQRMGIRQVGTPAPAPQDRLLKLPPGETVSRALARLRRQPGVAFAVPNFIAHADGAGYIPDDPGRGHVRGGWQRLQWNFLSKAGINAPKAWANLIAEHHPGGRGVTVAILDTGVAYRKWHHFRRSPDFNRTRFVHPYDFVDHNAYPLDREGHGTFVAGTVAESTNNGIGLTGLAYGASIMPVRVLDAQGTGDAATISRGIRYAVKHGARVINMSLEFTPDVTGGDIPDIIDAIKFATRHRVVVVAASGNEGVRQIAYPARESSAISVGATTRDRCVADYSNGGSSLSLVAPGGGDDASLDSDPDCHPGRRLPPIYQMTFFDGSNPDDFGFPGGIFGTSMSAPDVSATAAMIIAGNVVGRHPTPDQVRRRLEQTARPLGKGPRPNSNYGWGLLDAAAATAR